MYKLMTVLLDPGNLRHSFPSSKDQLSEFREPGGLVLQVPEKERGKSGTRCFPVVTMTMMQMLPGTGAPAPDIIQLHCNSPALWPISNYNF